MRLNHWICSDDVQLAVRLTVWDLLVIACGP
jgi:hypothetical protein